MNKTIPNLIVPGAAKSGTSSLHEYLNQHEDIYMSSIKEPHYFSSNDKFTNQKEDYYNLFNTDKKKSYYGESSTGYMVFPRVIDRIKDELSSPKFIFVLRNPIDRIFSHYWWLKGQGYESLEFEKAIQKDMHLEPKAEIRDGVIGYKNYYQWGLYGKWISNFYREFSKENIYIITFESLKNNPLETMNGCFEFLGVSKLDEVNETVSNRTKIIKNAKVIGNLENIIIKDNYLKNKLKKIKVIKILGEKVLSFLRNIKNSNEKTTKYPKMNIDTRKWLKDLYYDDYLLLVKETGLSFEEWVDFDNN